MNDEILRDIQEIFIRAMEEGKLGIALKAKELLGKEKGLFIQRHRRLEMVLNTLSEQELSEVIRAVEKQVTLDHKG